MSASLAESAFEVPPFPAVAGEVLRLTQQPDAGGPRIARVVERDPALAAMVLRVAQTAAHGGAPPASLQHALARLGTQALCEIVVAACLRPHSVRPEVADQVEAVWEHAVATAAYARRVSRARRRHTEAAFLCGLLHSFGALVVLQQDLDVDPVEMGVRAAEAYGMPAAVVATAQWVSDPFGADRHVDEVVTTALASSLAHRALDPDGAAPADGALLDWLDVYPDALAALEADAEVVLAQVRELA